MFRKVDLVMIAATLGVIAYTYTVKSQTKDLKSELLSLQDEVREEEHAIAILRADRSLLTSPQRVQSLVEVFSGELELVPIDIRRYVAIADIPMRPEKVEPEIDIDTLLSRIAGGEDAAIITGSVPAPAPGQDRP